MIRKFIEIRDRATFIPALAIPICGADSWLARRAGYGYEQTLILLIKLSTNQCAYDPYGGAGSRTMSVAHLHIFNHWDELVDGDMVDVEVILGEKLAQSESEKNLY